MQAILSSANQHGFFTPSAIGGALVGVSASFAHYHQPTRECLGEWAVKLLRLTRLPNGPGKDDHTLREKMGDAYKIAQSHFISSIFTLAAYHACHHLATPLKERLTHASLRGVSRALAATPMMALASTVYTFSALRFVPADRGLWSKQIPFLLSLPFSIGAEVKSRGLNFNRITKLTWAIKLPLMIIANIAQEAICSANFRGSALASRSINGMETFISNGLWQAIHHDMGPKGFYRYFFRADVHGCSGENSSLSSAALAAIIGQIPPLCHVNFRPSSGHPNPVNPSRSTPNANGKKGKGTRKTQKSLLSRIWGMITNLFSRKSKPSTSAPGILSRLGSWFRGIFTRRSSSSRESDDGSKTKNNKKS